jgi:hypothetical protein
VVAAVPDPAVAKRFVRDPIGKLVNILMHER